MQEKTSNGNDPKCHGSNSEVLNDNIEGSLYVDDFLIMLSGQEYEQH
jgi:hypothetical protein